MTRDDAAKAGADQTTDAPFFEAYAHLLRAQDRCREILAKLAAETPAERQVSP